MMYLKRAAALRAMTSGQPPATPGTNGGDVPMRVDTEQPSGNPAEVKEVNGTGPESAPHSEAQTCEILLFLFFEP